MQLRVLILFYLLLSGCRYYEVEQGQLYRSPQPNAEQLEIAIRDHGLKTVINLRGESPNSLWYKEEKEVVDRYGIEMINIGMSAGRIPHREDLLRLLDAFKSAARPMLVHCMAGVDRTGEASALYQMIYMDQPLDKALEMLSGLFGHFEAIMPSKRYFVRDVWKGEDWARDSYDPCKGGYKFYDVNNPLCRGEERPPLTSEEDT